LIAKKRDVKQAAMQQLLTGRTRLPGFTADWKEVRLGDLGSTFGGLTGKSSKDFGEGNSSFVTFMNVMSNVVLNKQGIEKVRIGNGERQSQLLEGDVIFNGSSETPEEVGFGSTVPIELSGLYLNSFCFGFRRIDTKSLDPKFFAYLTRSPLGRDIIRPMAQGSTRYNIAKTNLLNGRFPLPPLKEQEAIAEVLTVMDEELEALAEQVLKLRMVKEGMMQDLLSGKVRLV
jgi:type I restriction enzyme S subunit